MEILDTKRCYEILGLEPNATPAQIHDIYRDLVRQWHPDKVAHNPKLQAIAQEELKDINAAYNFLKTYSSGTDTYSSQSEQRAQAEKSKREDEEAKRRRQEANKQEKERYERVAQRREREAERLRVQQEAETIYQREQLAQAKEEAKRKEERERRVAAVRKAEQEKLWAEEMLRRGKASLLAETEWQRCVANNLCVVCGKPLNLLDRIVTVIKHRQC